MRHGQNSNIRSSIRSDTISSSIRSRGDNSRHISNSQIIVGNRNASVQLVVVGRTVVVDVLLCVMMSVLLNCVLEEKCEYGVQ